MIFTALYHANMDITDQLLDLYEQEFSSLPRQDDFLHPDLANLRAVRGRPDDGLMRQLLSDLECEIAAVYPGGPQPPRCRPELQRFSMPERQIGSPMTVVSWRFSSSAPDYHAVFAELTRLRGTSGSKAAVRQRLLDAIRFLSRRATPRLAAAMASPIDIWRRLHLAPWSEQS